MRRIALVLFLLSSCAVSLRARDVDFENDVMPILGRYGCNAGPCHGKSGGQGGFQLSLLGFDPNSDFNVITKDAGGRRILRADPDKCLFLTKPSAVIPHGGGRRLARAGPEYKLLRDWIAAGAPRRVEKAPKLLGISVEPPQVVLANAEIAKMSVTAKYDDGSTREVTRLTSFLSNEAPIAAVDEHGTVKAGSITCLLYTSPSPRDQRGSRMPSSA